MSKEYQITLTCDVCGATVVGDSNPHLDPRLAGWVEYSIKRKYGSACRDAEVDYWDGQGDLCPKCMSKTGIKLREASK